MERKEKGLVLSQRRIYQKEPESLQHGRNQRHARQRKAERQPRKEIDGIKRAERPTEGARPFKGKLYQKAHRTPCGARPKAWCGTSRRILSAADQSGNAAEKQRQKMHKNPLGSLAIMPIDIFCKSCYNDYNKGERKTPKPQKGRETMQILSGTKREITIMQWREQLEKHISRANDSMECFRRYAEIDDLDRLIESCEKLLETAKNTKQVIAFMNENNI